VVPVSLTEVSLAKPIEEKGILLSMASVLGDVR